MNYYESVVVDYLRADRSLFVNTECCIQLNPGENPDKSGPHWYCDAVAADFRQKTVFLCEISYSASMHDLIHRLQGWNEHWSGVRDALARESNLPSDWQVQPWLFVPEHRVKTVLKGLEQIESNQALSFSPVITTLEMVQPWEYCLYNRRGEKPKPDCIPFRMRGTALQVVDAAVQ